MKILKFKSQCYFLVRENLSSFENSSTIEYNANALKVLSKGTGSSWIAFCFTVLHFVTVDNFHLIK